MVSFTKAMPKEGRPCGKIKVLDRPANISASESPLANANGTPREADGRTSLVLFYQVAAVVSLRIEVERKLKLIVKCFQKGV